jgi:perosamine synthetase
VSNAQHYIPFGRPHFGDDEVAAVTAVLRSGWVGMGEQTIAFEQELAASIGAPHVVSVSSCTAALFLSLIVAGVGEDDEVICPSLTWCSTANAARYLGARPVFCDVDAQTLVVTPETILACVTPRTRAVIVVHFGGLAIDVAALRRVLPAHIPIVEDAAHALGARYPDGRAVGSCGNLTCFSFYANKNLSTGEGGAIAVADDAVAERLRSLRQHGLPSNAWTRYVQPARSPEGVSPYELGYKMNYTDLQASIGRVQLRRQPEFHARRLELAEFYARQIAARLPGVGHQQGLLDPHHARHLFVIFLSERLAGPPRDGVVRRARAAGVGLSVHYPPLHRMALYGHEGALPLTETMAGRLVTLPIGVAMTDDDAERVVGMLEHELHALSPRRTIPLMPLPPRLPVPPAAVPPPAQPAQMAGEHHYGFGGRLTAAFPSQVIVDVSEVCNLACTHCEHPAFKRSHHYAARMLDVTLHDKLVDEVRTAGAGSVQYIRYTSNGEPLTHPRIFEMLAAATQHSGVQVALTTNGTLLTPKRAEQVIASGVSLVDISLDAASPDTYAAIRVGGKLPKVEEQVAHLIALARQAGSRTRVVVSFIEQPGNRHEVEQFERTWRDRGAHEVVIRRLHSCAGSKPMTAAEPASVMAEPDRRPCLYPWERILLNAQGQLDFCPSDWVHGGVLADYRHTTIQEVWQGEAYQALRRAHLENDYSRHAFCGQCPDWATTRWPHQGRSYADMMRELKPSA